MRLVAIAIAVAACHAPARVPTSKLADLDDSYTDGDRRREASVNACPAIVNPRLWRIEKAGKTSHVFGTYHVGVGRDRLPAVVTDAFASARVIAFESIGDVAAPPDDEPTRPLSAELGSTAWQRLVALIGKDNAKAVEDRSALIVTLLLVVMYIDYDAMLDEELEQEANRLDKRVVGLESDDTTVPLMRRWLNASTLRASLMASRGRRAMRKEALAGLADYCAGRDKKDDDTLFDHRGSGMTEREAQKLQHDLLDGRNLAWMKPIEALLAEGDAFIAVGAAHLRGPGSVIALLVRRGYAVTRVGSTEAVEASQRR